VVFAPENLGWERTAGERRASKDAAVPSVRGRWILARKHSDWRLVMVVSNGRICTGRYKFADGLVTVEYADAMRSGRCAGEEALPRQAEKLLRQLAEREPANY
jgi:hypothetical protein